MSHFPVHGAFRSVSLVAHQGGWDEILLVAGPIAVIIVLLAIVKRRIDAHTPPVVVAEEIRDSSNGVDGSSVDGGTDPA